MKANTTQVLKEDREKKRGAAAGATIGIELEEKLEVPERKCSKIWIRSSLEFTGELCIAMHWKSYIHIIMFSLFRVLDFAFVGSFLYGGLRHTCHCLLQQRCLILTFGVLKNRDVKCFFLCPLYV